MTHFSKLGLLFSCKHVSAIVIICSNSKVQTVSFLVYVWVCVLAQTHCCSWQHNYAVCWTFFSTSTNKTMLGCFFYYFHV